MPRLLVTGAMGFIGSNLVRKILRENPDVQITALDAYTYAARPKWVFDFLSEAKIPEHRFQAVKCDLTERAELERLVESLEFDQVIHLAAESHVCRSIDAPAKFVHSNVLGTLHLLDACRAKWKDDASKIFHHVSTDEVFGELEDVDAPFSEYSQVDPRSPYAASKAASDHLVSAYHHTYGMNTRVTNCSNNFGPNQHEEKLIPRAVLKLLSGEPMTVYGQGSQVRDWLWVDEHVDAILAVMARGKPGARYCVGGEKELSNLNVIEQVRLAMCEELDRDIPLLLEYTNGRPTDDKRYAINNNRIRELGWSPRPELFTERLKETIRWYAQRIGE